MGHADEITQRDLRLRSKDIMDAVEGGTSFTVTRDGRPMGQLVPLRRRFVTKAQFVASSAAAGVIDPDQLHTDIAAGLNFDLDDPYAL
ncbi:MAG: prevent-host-death protein [Micrococcales bacterium]|nr:prevent-host-death protein [Micrococcales bacterium]